MSKKKTTEQTELLQLVHREGKRVFCTSLEIAQRFKKRHDHVLRAIRNLECPSDFMLPNFGERDYIDERGNIQPMYEISRDGFTLLVMGFKGRNAMQWKLKYIAAFNRMEKIILDMRLNHEDPQWLEARKIGKEARLAETDVVKAFVEYATAQGSSNASRYYANITKGTYGALFILEHGGKWQGLREYMSQHQLTTLASAERIAQKALTEAMEIELPYKDAYQFAIGKVKAFADLIGVTKIPDDPNLKLIK